MNLSDFKQREAVIRQEWFKDHRAVFQDWPARFISVLTWRRPDTSNYYVRYFINGRVLCVYGDLGEAVYEWGQNLTWEFLAQCDLGYFEGKCQASEKGRHYVDWDERKARDGIAYQLREDKITARLWKNADGPSSLGNQQEWGLWLHREGYDVFRGSYTELFDIGEVTSLRCQSHLIGVRMALAQRDNNPFCPEI